ncbi:hypothetical protein HETIRDRAFT_172029 [Heterobasidion irregulare TC 32-1]|uniref:Uncharacterized protein n=1 Tax=Heterobasidion irregulare (strain TC 32-1) TaxID=747525 RepID=W4K0W4_HETIT|nr:uncharacterized protein HETIRDRAFT_172029 [Heterobasidion irregulare TC 32-1]ETW79437.1 hypothetical protein HETIRDRAFT_172029 [Heterobasidion irregulare TC 32-1]
MVKIRKDWHWNYDQDMFLLMPPLKTIDAFESRRVALNKSESDDCPDIMSLYGEEDIFEYRLVPLTEDITNIFRFDRDDDLVPPTTPDADQRASESEADPIPPTTSDGGDSAPDSELLLSTTSQADDTASVSDSLLPTTPSVIDHTTSESDALPPATSEVDCPASDLGPPEPQPQLSGQRDNIISDGDSPASNTNHLRVDVGTEADIDHPSNETEIPATQDSTSKMNRPASKSNWSCHCYPFDTLPVLRSHALPHFVLLNAGEKLEKRELQPLASVVARIFKIHEFRAMDSLINLHNIYDSWVHAVVPSPFGLKPQLPSSTNKTTNLGGEQEQAKAKNTISKTLRAGAADMNNHPGPRSEHNDGQIESDRSKRYYRRQDEKDGPASHSPAGAVTDAELPTHASVANTEASREPSHASMSASPPALDSNHAASSVVPAAPAGTIESAEAIGLAAPAPVEPTEVPLYSQVAVAGKSVTSGKAPIGTSGQTHRGIPTKIPTAIQTSARNRADVSGPFQQDLTQSGKLTAGSGILIQNKTVAQENSAWTTVRHRSSPAGSKNKGSRRASGSLGRDSVPANSRAIDAGEIASHDTTWTTAKRSQAVSESHAKGTGHASGHPGKGKVSPRTNLPRTGASATLNVPVRVEGDPQSQRITRRLPAPSLGLASASQDTRTNEHSSKHKSTKSGGEGALNPPEQKRRRVARPSEGEAVLPSSRIPLPAKSKKFVDRMKPKMTPSMSNRRVSFAQDQGEDPPVASGSQGMNEKMPVNVTRTQDKDETTGDRRDSGSKHTDDNGQDGKGRETSKSGKKRRYSRRSLGETI